MKPSGRRFSPGGFLRPRRAGTLLRNALIFYLVSRPLLRTINPQRAQMRRRYAPRRGLLGTLLGVLRGL